MKTTLELPDDLLRRAKQTAARRKVTLRRVFTDALESELDRDSRKDERWKKHFGSMKQYKRETGRIDRVIAEEFERVDEEAWK